MIYGMGVQSLATELEMSEADAEIFMRKFHGAFPGYIYSNIYGIPLTRFLELKRFPSPSFETVNNMGS